MFSICNASAAQITAGAACQVEISLRLAHCHTTLLTHDQFARHLSDTRLADQT